MRLVAISLYAATLVFVTQSPSAAADGTGAVFGIGSVTLGEIADPEFRGDQVRFSVEAHAGERARGFIHVVHDHDGRVADLRGGLDCALVEGDAATLSGVITTGNDHVGERIVVGIRDHGMRDGLIFGLQPASQPDPCGWTVPAIAALMPVERGGFSIHE